MYHVVFRTTYGDISYGIPHEQNKDSITRRVAMLTNTYAFSTSQSSAPFTVFLTTKDHGLDINTLVSLE